MPHWRPPPRHHRTTHSQAEQRDIISSKYNVQQNAGECCKVQQYAQRAAVCQGGYSNLAEQR